MVGSPIRHVKMAHSYFIEQIYRNNKNYQGIIFLDRDGTINREVNYLNDKTQIEILPTVAKGIRLLNRANIVVAVITNQPVVARGLITTEDLKKINDTLVKRLKKKGAYIDVIYSCPHHPDAELKRFRVKCDCRKPGIAMYNQAICRYGPLKIFGVIGDQTRDVAAAQSLGLANVVVKTGFGGKDGTYKVKPDFICDNFFDATCVLLKETSLIY